MTNSAWNIHRDRLLAQFCRLKDSIRLRMLPGCGDVDAKLQAYSDELNGQHFTSEEPSFQEGEYKAELYALFEDEIRAAQSDVAALAVAALYHHWERSVKWLIARKNRPVPVPDLNNANFGKLKTHLQFHGLTDDCKKALDDIDFGRLIANVIKHGAGSSADDLKAGAPDLFQRPWDDENFDLPSCHSVNLIWVQPHHLCTVADAIRRFWETLPDDRFPAMPPRTLDAILSGDFD